MPLTLGVTRTGRLVVLAFATGFVLAGCCEVNAIRTSSLPDGVVGQEYSAALEHNCEGKSSLDSTSWRVSGALPPGLRFSEEGRFSGRPTSAGTFSVAVALTTFASGNFTDELQDLKNFTITIRPAA